MVNLFELPLNYRVNSVLEAPLGIVFDKSYCVFSNRCFLFFIFYLNKVFVTFDKFD